MIGRIDPAFPPLDVEFPSFLCSTEPNVMNRKWTVFGLAAGVLVTLSAATLSTAQDEKETVLGAIMEKVQKHNSIITKGTRTPVAYKKAQKDVEKSAKELAKLAKEAKPIKDYLKNAKDVAKPGEKWDEIMDHFKKSSEDLAKLVADSGTSQAEAKKAFGAVKKSCAECHTIFRVDE
jgi:cytochrome c556